MARTAKIFLEKNSSSKYIIYQTFSVQKVPVVSKLVLGTTTNPLSYQAVLQGNMKSKIYKYFFRLCVLKQKLNFD